MRSTFLSMLLIAPLAGACGTSDKADTTSQASPSSMADAGKPAADAARMEPAEDAGPTPAPRDCDKVETPGNDCDDAVGCRGALECGLDAKSCCVQGLDVSGVTCADGVTCPADFGRASCDGPEDCDGQACCVDTVAGNTECLPACGTKIALCHTTDDCEEGKTCRQGNTFTWWGVCN